MRRWIRPKSRNYFGYKKHFWQIYLIFSFCQFAMFQSHPDRHRSIFIRPRNVNESIVERLFSEGWRNERKFI